MRMRIISAAVVLGLGIVGITLARQAPTYLPHYPRYGERNKRVEEVIQASEKPPQNRASLRAQVAKLRAEVELLQLERDADADILKKLMVDMKNVDCMEAVKGPMKEQVEALLKGAMKEKMAAFKGQLEAFKVAMNGQLPAALGALPDLQEEFNNMFIVDETTAKIARPLLERLKKEFVQKATELHEKRLEFADVEKRYNEAK